MNARTLTIAALIGLAGHASGDIKVDFYISDGSPAWESGVLDTDYTLDGSNNVEIINVPTDAISVRIFSNVTSGTLDNLGVVTIDDSGTLNTILISKHYTHDDIVAISNGVHNWAGLDGDEADDLILQASLTGDLTGEIIPRRIRRLDIDGDISGAVSVQGTGLTNAAVSIIAGVGSTGDISGDITAVSGDYPFIRAFGAISSESITTPDSIGDIIAGTSISCEYITAGESIGLVIAEDGDIGTSSVLTEIMSTRENGTAAVNIGIVTGDNIFADIIASSTATAKGDIERVVAGDLINHDGLVTDLINYEGGNFTGILIAHTGDYRTPSGPNMDDAVPTFNAVVVDGTLIYQDTPTTAIAFETLTADSVIFIDGELAPVVPPLSGSQDRIIVVSGDPTSSEGMLGQIIINAADGEDDWTGKVEFTGASTPFTLDDDGTQPNEAPFYERLPSELGGGAIGLAPFNFHAEACVPKADSGKALFPNDYASYEVTIEHYGPVFEATQQIRILQSLSCTRRIWEQKMM